jgi:hypothetical protein
MQRQVHKGSFLLLEGVTDHKRFRRIVDTQRCCVVICYGKANVIDAVDRLCEDGFLGIIGLIDADFDRILGTLTDHEGIIASATHDFDLDVLTTRVMERYLLEVSNLPTAGSPTATTVDAHAVLQNILEALRPLSILRYANEREGLGYKLSDCEVGEFFDGSKIDVTSMVEVVSQGRFSRFEDKQRLSSLIARYSSLSIDLFQLTSGHDVCAAVGVALRQVLGSRRRDQTLRSEIELHIRLAADRNDLEECGLVGRLRAWEVTNEPFSVLSR